MKKIVEAILITFLQVGNLIAAPPSSLISGPSTGTAFQTSTYNYDDGTVYTTFSWSLANGLGTVTSSTRSGSLYTATIKWTGTGLEVVHLNVNGSQIAAKSVTLGCPTLSTPTADFSYAGGSTPGCGSVVISYSSDKNSGPTWYWQTSPTGTSTTSSALSYTAAKSGTYYIRANCGTSWSPAQSTSAVTVKPIPSISGMNKTICSGNSANILLTNNLSGTTNTWTVSSSNVIGSGSGSGVSGTSSPFTYTLAQILATNTNMSGTAAYTVTPTNNGCSGTPLVVTATVKPVPTASVMSQSIFSGQTTSIPISNPNNVSGTTFSWIVSPINVSGASPGTGNSISQTLTSSGGKVTYTITPTSSGCDGQTIATSVTVFPLPSINASQTIIVKGGVVNMDAGSGYDSYIWKNSAGVTVFSSITSPLISTYQTNTPDTYTVLVTKLGMTASASFTLRDQFNGLAKNYVFTNTVSIAGVVDPAVVNNLPVDLAIQSVIYFDGLGRSEQEVYTQTTTTKMDIVTPKIYDEFGRDYRVYAPVVLENNGRYKSQILDNNKNYSGSASSFYTNSSDKIVDESRPFSETIFEQSPLNRPIKSYGAGSDWGPQGRDKYVSYQYLLNTHGTGAGGSQEKVIAWKVDPSSGLPVREAAVSGYIESGGYFSSNQLSVKVTLDESFHGVREYSNKYGQVVLKKVQLGPGANLNSTTDWVMTYFVYDDLGKLRYVFQPELVRKIHNGLDTDPLSGTDLINLTFQYKYDSRGRMVEKQIPGVDAVYMVYDDRDRLVLLQDGNLRRDPAGADLKKWLFTKYDAYNRPVLTGIYNSSTVLNQIAMQGLVDSYYSQLGANGGARYETFISTAGNVHGYDNKSFPVVSDPNQYLTVTYYDNYDFKPMFASAEFDFKPAELPEPVLPGLGTSWLSKVVGKITGSKIRMINTASWLKSVHYFDDHYRMIQAIGENPKGHEVATSVYDFTGRVVQTKTSLFTGQPSSWTSVTNATVASDAITGTNSTNWTAGAVSSQTLPAGADGWAEFTVVKTSPIVDFGLSAMNQSNNYATTNFSWYVNGITARPYNLGAAMGTAILVYPGDVLRVERVNGLIYWKRNGLIVYPATYPSSVTSLTTLMADAALYNNGSEIFKVRLSATFSNFLATAKTLGKRFVYDHAGRLMENWHRIDGAAEILVSKNEYNELGQLVDKKLHSTTSTATDAKQSVDFRYNIRGWLTRINSSDIVTDYNDPANAGEARDLFGMNLAYNEDLGTGNANSNPALDLRAYNGNISAQKWSTSLGLGTVKEFAYNFNYDPMNRLKDANHLESSAPSIWVNGEYNENGFQYDLNGNIKNLKRNGKGAVLIDDLACNYGTASAPGNKLFFVTDNTLNSADKLKGFADRNTNGNDYTYDWNGNMLTDLNKGVSTNILYNFLNLPESVTRNNGSVTFIYDASGRKHGQVMTSGSAQRSTEYVNDWVFENNDPQFVRHDEGRIVLQDRRQLFTSDGDDASSWQGTTNASVTPLTINGETYVKVIPIAGAALSKVGATPIGSNYYTVAPGQRYVFRVKGYSNSAKVAYLYVKGNTSDLIWTGANLPTSAATEMWIESDFIVPANTTQITLGVLYNTGTATSSDFFLINKVDLVQVTSTMPAYQYHIKDHLGNVRMTFTTRDDIDTSLATLETARAVIERGQFLYYNEAVIVNSDVFDYSHHTAAGSANTTFYSTRLTGGATNSINGLAKSLSVMPGDKIDVEVFAKYLDPDQNNLTQTLKDFIISIAAGGSAPAGTIIDGGAPGSLGTNIFPFPGLMARTNDDGTGPKAYLNYLVFNRDFSLVLDKGFKRISAAALEDGHNPDHLHERLSFDGADEISIKEPGYVYVWLSNENATTVEVYFDDFEVTLTKSPIIQEDDYYPFGFSVSTCSRENNVTQNYLYNGKEFQRALNLDVEDFGARMYDPALGRWWVMDRKAEYYFAASPYVYALNQPTNAIDPDGGVVIFINGNHFGTSAPGASYWKEYNGPRVMQWHDGSAFTRGYYFENAVSKSFDTKVMDQLDDHATPRYYDGSRGGWHPLGDDFRLSASASGRWLAGFEDGLRDAKEIIANLARDKSGNIVETIKIITHSMGGAYGKGFVVALKAYINTLPIAQQKQILISLVADFDPYQASDLNADPDIKTTQFLHKDNSNILGMGWLANEMEKGIDGKEIHPNTGQSTDHSILSFFNDIPGLEAGKYKWNGNKWVIQKK